MLMFVCTCGFQLYLNFMSHPTEWCDWLFWFLKWKVLMVRHGWFWSALPIIRKFTYILDDSAPNKWLSLEVRDESKHRVAQLLFYNGFYPSRALRPLFCALVPRPQPCFTHNVSLLGLTEPDRLTEVFRGQKKEKRNYFCAVFVLIRRNEPPNK